jgi:hypothetical protein
MLARSPEVLSLVLCCSLPALRGLCSSNGADCSAKNIGDHMRTRTLSDSTQDNSSRLGLRARAYRPQRRGLRKVLIVCLTHVINKGSLECRT